MTAQMMINGYSVLLCAVFEVRWLTYEVIISIRIDNYLYWKSFRNVFGDIKGILNTIYSSKTMWVF